MSKHESMIGLKIMCLLLVTKAHLTLNYSI